MNNDQLGMNESVLYSEAIHTLSKDKIYHQHVHKVTVDNAEQNLEHALASNKKGNFLLITYMCILPLIMATDSKEGFARGICQGDSN